MMDYLWLIPLLPLVGSAINGILGKRFPKPLISAIACGTRGRILRWSLLPRLSACCACLPDESATWLNRLFTWIASGDFVAKAEFLLDPLSAVMLLVVTGVGFLIHIYSIGYMHAEDGYYRFFSYLNLFMFSMLVLVLAGNFLLMFVGWEGVGLCSYLLIGYYFDRRSAGDAGKKAFIVNRIGDVGFILGIFLIFVTFKSMNFDEVFRADRRRSGTFSGGSRFRPADRDRHSSLRGSDRKERADSRSTSGCPDAMEGPDSGKRPDPRRHHGDCGRVYGRALRADIQPGSHRPGGRLPSSGS